MVIIECGYQGHVQLTYEALCNVMYTISFRQYCQHCFGDAQTGRCHVRLKITLPVYFSFHSFLARPVSGCE